MKIFLCDDQKEHIGQIVDMFSTISGEYPVRIESFTSAEKLLEQLEKESVSLPDMVFLDIEMPEIDGIFLGKKIKKQYPGIYLVFVTAFAEYAISGYEADAFRYLLKPITKNKLKKVLSEFETEENKKKKNVVKTRKGECFLPIQIRVSKGH